MSTGSCVNIYKIKIFTTHTHTVRSSSSYCSTMTIEYILPSAKQPEPECAEPQRPADRPPLLCKRALANVQTHTRAHAWECTRGWPVVCRRAMSDRVGFDFDLMLTRARALSLQTGTQHFVGSGADGVRGWWFCVYHKALYHKVLTCVCVCVGVCVRLTSRRSGGF